MLELEESQQLTRQTVALFDEAGTAPTHPSAEVALRKREQGALAVHEHEARAIDAILSDWNQAQQEHGFPQAVMIAGDNATRTMLNYRAGERLARDGSLAADGVSIADQEFRAGDRVIASHNDRYRDIDNGTLRTVSEIDGQAR